MVKRIALVLSVVLICLYQLEAQDFNFDKDLSIQMVTILEKNIHYVFPYGSGDKAIAEINGGFKFGKTEVTYGMWNFIRK